MGANKLRKFKNKKISIVLVLLIAVIPFFTTAEETDSDMLVHLKGLRMSTDFAESPEQDGRIREMEVEALSIGTIAGSYYASKKINELLDKRASYLDVTFDFHDSVISYKGVYILPPVISERKNDTEIVGGKTFTVKRQVYSMETSPRFVYEVPTWRNYLLLTPVKPQQPDNSLLPRSKDEVALWEKNIEKGWSTGVRQAIYVVNGRYAKLTRDLVGLDRYHLLVAAKIVSEPVIKHSYTAVSGGGYEMSLEDSVVEIQVNPLLNTDRFSWQSIPRLPDVSGLFPRGIFSETDLEIANDE